MQNFPNLFKYVQCSFASMVPLLWMIFDRIMDLWNWKEIIQKRNSFYNIISRRQTMRALIERKILLNFSMSKTSSSQTQQTCIRTLLKQQLNECKQVVENIINGLFFIFSDLESFPHRINAEKSKFKSLNNLIRYKIHKTI